jgi:peptidoglycan/LPS O-acetylase OafA/YrhL
VNQKSIHIPFLDIARGFAILIVFLGHCLRPAYGFFDLPWDGWFRDFDVPRSFLALLPITYGWTGVAIFFVVSGFCIHLSHMNSGEKDFRSFFVRRLFRIYPPYLFALLFFAFVYPFKFISQFDNFSGWVQLVTHGLLIHNFNQDTFFGINPVFWSIAVEVQLYCMYPLLILIVSKTGWRRALIAVGILEVAIRGIGSVYYSFSNDALPLWFLSSPFACWLSWSIGAAIADSYLKGYQFSLAKHPIWLWFLVAMTSNFFRPLSSFSFLFFAILTAVILSKSLRVNFHWTETQWGRYIATHLRFAGVVSYSLYLIHFPILNLVPITLNKFNLYTSFHPLLTFVICLSVWPVVLALSWLMYKTVEIPSISIGKLLNRKIKLAQ